MSLIPKEKLCDKCGNTFKTSIDEQNTCTDCLIKPRATSLRFNPQPSLEVPMSDNISNSSNVNAPTGEKICVDCKNPFKPNSGRQIRCDDCREKKSHQPKELSANRLKAVPPVQKPSGGTFISMGLELLENIGVNKLKIEGDHVTISIERTEQ